MIQVASHRRHDRSEQGRGLREPRRAGSWGSIARDKIGSLSTRFSESGAPVRQGRDLSPDYGDWSNTHRRLAQQRRVKKVFRNPDRQA